ncbi:MAG: class I SAM-dependent methyltransferase [Fidelibacterota bacterium]
MKELNLNNLTRPEAFQTGISKLVRKTVLNQTSKIREPILDACCGNGIFLLEYCAIVRNYHDVYGVDIDDDALNEAKQLFQDNLLKPPTLITHDVFELPFNDNYFQTVFCLNTLINIYPFELVEKLILELYRVLKPDGRLFIDFRNKNNPLLNYTYRKNIEHSRLTTHAHKKSDFNHLLNLLSPGAVQFHPIGSPLPFLAKGYLMIIRK